MKIQAIKLAKKYNRRQIFSDISFFLDTGEVMAIAGANGAGKTTLLKILALTALDFEGEYLIDDKNTKYFAKEFRQSVAYVPQQLTAFLELTVYDNLKYWLKKGNESSFNQTIENLGLEKYLGVRANALSGGYLRRLNLATALINDPKILIMDEPLVGVDIDTRLAFSSWIKALSKKGVTIIYTTHHSDEIEHIANCMGVVYNGGMKFIPEIEGLYLDNLISRFIKLN